MGKKSTGPKAAPIAFGPLPVQTINATIDLDLEPGETIFTAPSQDHVRKNHGADYERCLPFVGGIIANPLFIGDDFKNAGKIELIGRVAQLGGGLLVAVTIVRKGAAYEVNSFYPISEEKIVSRRKKGYLRPAQKH